MIRLLLSKGANACVLNFDGDTLLHVAMQISDIDRSIRLEIADMLLGAGCDPLACNCHGELLCHMVAKQDYRRIAKHLLLFCTHSLAGFVSRGFRRVVEYLLSLGCPLPRQY